MKDNYIPCWLTNYQQEQVKVLQEMGLEFIDTEDLFEEITWEEALKVEDWEFIVEFPSKPKESDDYPNGDEYVIYARCNGAIFIMEYESRAENSTEARQEFNEAVREFENAKKRIKAISKAYSANFKQLCLV